MRLRRFLSWDPFRSRLTLQHFHFRPRSQSYCSVERNNCTCLYSLRFPQKQRRKAKAMILCKTNMALPLAEEIRTRSLWSYARYCLLPARFVRIELISAIRGWFEFSSLLDSTSAEFTEAKPRSRLLVRQAADEVLQSKKNLCHVRIFKN